METQHTLQTEVNEEVVHTDNNLTAVQQQQQETEMSQNHLRKTLDDDERVVAQEVREAQEERSHQLEEQVKKVEEDTKDNE